MKDSLARTNRIDRSRGGQIRRDVVAFAALVSLKRGSGESLCTEISNLFPWGPNRAQKQSERDARHGQGKGEGGRVGRSARIYVFGEGQGNEGSDKCSERAEDSWMQRVERKRKPVRGDGRGGEGRDGCSCASRARYRDEFHSPDRFGREGRDEDRFGTGNPRYPVFEKATEGPESDGFSPQTAGVESAGDRIPGIRNLHHVAFANIIEDLCGRGISFYQNLPEI